MMLPRINVIRDVSVRDPSELIFPPYSSAHHSIPYHTPCYHIPLTPRFNSVNIEWPVTNPHSNSIPSPTCYRCMISAQISPDSVSLWRDAVHNFCSTSAPSIYLFLIDMISFANLASAPRPWAALGPDIYAVTTASSRFTPATELNRPGPLKWSATASPPTKSAIKTETAEIPQSVLDQLPPNWPYTTFGVARQPGVWTTYNLTNAQGQLTAQVVASLQWYPKPIGHQRVVFVPWLDPRLVTNSAMRSVTASTTATAAMPTPSATTTAKSGGRSTDIGKPPTISQMPVRGTPPLTTSIDAVSGTPTPTGTSIGVGSSSLGEVHSSQTRAASGSSITTSTSGDWNGHRK
jgi:hypothetical protein